jgi:DNA polymerase III epsilon subunit-like protein
MRSGKYLQDIVEEFLLHLKTVTHIFIHNLDFDMTILKSELYRIQRMDVISELDKKIQICTMKTTIPLVNLPNLKYPRLTELYKFATGEDIEQTHSAITDARILLDCVSHLYTNHQFLFGLKSIPIC